MKILIGKMLHLILVFCFLSLYLTEGKGYCLAPQSFSHNPELFSEFLASFEGFYDEKIIPDLKLFQDEQESQRKKWLHDYILESAKNRKLLLDPDFLTLLFYDVAKTFPFLDANAQPEFITFSQLRSHALNTKIIPLRPLLRLFISSLGFVALSVGGTLFFIGGTLMIYVPWINYLYRKYLIAGETHKKMIRVNLNKKLSPVNITLTLIHEYLHLTPGYEKTHFQDLIAFCYLKLLGFDSEILTMPADIFFLKGIELAKKNYDEKKTFSGWDVSEIYSAKDKYSKRVSFMNIKNTGEPYMINSFVSGYLIKRHELMRAAGYTESETKTMLYDLFFVFYESFLGLDKNLNFSSLQRELKSAQILNSAS